MGNRIGLALSRWLGKVWGRIGIIKHKNELKECAAFIRLTNMATGSLSCIGAFLSKPERLFLEHVADKDDIIFYTQDYVFSFFLIKRLYSNEIMLITTQADGHLTAKEDIPLKGITANKIRSSFKEQINLIQQNDTSHCPDNNQEYQAVH